MNNYENKPKTPYYEGWEAYLNTIELGYNPYPEFTNEHKQWVRGWKEAKEDWISGLAG